jgi:hypothetical protein
LKKYGAIVADNGGFFSISVCPDDRYPSNAFNNLSTIGIANFEVIQTTGASEGPRSAGAPTVDAGSDRLLTLPVHTVTLPGTATGTNLTLQWTEYSGPASVSFANAAQASTTATFTAPGVYTLMLSATDGIHAAARDAVVITVCQPVSISRAGNDMQITFPTLAGQGYRVERSSALSGSWTILADHLPGTGNTLQVTDPNILSTASAFYRVTTLP